jgi:rhamnosyltransferase
MDSTALRRLRIIKLKISMHIARIKIYKCFIVSFRIIMPCFENLLWEKIPYDDVNFAEDQKWAKAILENGYIKAYADDAIVFHSHNYTMIEVFRRSFEEAVSFQIHFQHQILSSLKSLIGICLHKIRIDYSTLIRSKEISFLEKIHLLFYRPIYDSLRFLGYFLGSKKRLSAFLYSTISIDHRLLKDGKGRKVK